MPDFGIGELLGTFGLGDALGLGGLASWIGDFLGIGAAAAPEVAAGAVPELAAGAASSIPEIAAASVPLDIGAGAGFGSAADAAAAAAGSTGLASGLEGTVGLGALAGAPTVGATAAETLGLGSGALDASGGFAAPAAAAADAALPPASTLASGTLADLTPQTAVPGITSTGSISAPSSIGPLGSTAPAASTPVSPISSAAAVPTDIASSTAAFPGVGGGTSANAAAPGASFLDKLSPSSLASGAVNQIAKNPLGVAGGLGALGVGLLGNKKPAGTNQLGAIASQQGAQGAQLQKYLTSGTLPAGMQASVDAATKAAKQKIVSNYAARGLPTDPTKNSSLAAELAGVDQNAIITTAQLGQQLLNTGLSETQLSADVYNKLVGIDQTQQAQISQAIANFARAVGGGGGINLQLAK